MGVGGAEGMNRRREWGGSKGLSWEWLLKFLSVSVSVRVLQLLFQCHCFIQCLYSQCAHADGIPHLAERTAAEYAPREAG